MVSESKKIGVSDVAAGKDLAKGNSKVNTIFVAEVFNTRHGLEELNEEEKEEVAKFINDYDDIEGSREERAFRFWINSLGIEGVFINNLYEECRDGDVFCKVCDKIKPGSVDWKGY
jgi:plastin-1